MTKEQTSSIEVGNSDFLAEFKKELENNLDLAPHKVAEIAQELLRSEGNSEGNKALDLRKHLDTLCTEIEGPVSKEDLQSLFEKIFQDTQEYFTNMGMEDTGCFKIKGNDPAISLHRYVEGHSEHPNDNMRTSLIGLADNIIKYVEKVANIAQNTSDAKEKNIQKNITGINKRGSAVC